MANLNKTQKKNRSQARPGNTNNLRHGASGLERRIEKKLPLRSEDLQEKRDIQREMGYDALPAGPLGLAIDLISDNVLLARRFQQARAWAAERGDRKAYERLGQRSGWRNDKAIAQLLELAKQQAQDAGVIDYESVLQQQNGTQE